MTNNSFFIGIAGGTGSGKTSIANAIAAGKRPLSSMTPTFIESDDQIAILGTPGGSRIISMVILLFIKIIVSSFNKINT